MAETPVSEAEVLRRIHEVKTQVKEHEDEMPNRVWKAMDGLSRTLLAQKQKKGQPGWANELKDEAGRVLWTEAEVSTLENVLPAFVAMGGGGMNPGDLKFGPQSELVTPSMPLDFSLDAAVESVQKQIQFLDEKNRELAQIVGPVAQIQKGSDPVIGPFAPYLPVGIPISRRIFLPLANAFLEACRLLVSNNVFDVPILRQILSVVLAGQDVSRGEWKDGVLSLLGVYSRTWMVQGMIGKTARWVQNFISPDLQRQIERDLQAGTKSAIIGSWLWLVSIVAPDTVRDQFNEMVALQKQPLENLNEQLAALEQQAQITAAPLGATVKFPRVPLDEIPSFDDIQNFQSLLHRPEILCQPQAQAMLQNAMQSAPIKLALELLDIPTQPAKVEEFCKDVPKSIPEAITKSLQPTIIPGIPKIPSLTDVTSVATTAATNAATKATTQVTSVLPPVPTLPVPISGGGKSRKNRANKHGIPRKQTLRRLF